MLKKLLIANRGEIAARIARTARRMGLGTVAVYSEPDANAPHVAAADERELLGPAEALKSYLDIAKVIAAAKKTGADAIHPGYGFLSENPDFAAAVANAGLVFVGPSAAAMRQLGDKASAKAVADRAGVTVVPGYDGASQEPTVLKREAERIGFPLLIKAVAGGGGRGMRVVEKADDFLAALESAVREATAAFGDGRVLLERQIVRPRHIEVQVFADRYGNAVHMFERECSAQRRHQKVIEEAPAPGIHPTLRRKLTDAAVKLALATRYEGAGTVEFLVEGGTLGADAPWYFIEANTRLQVEHPVTEMITGLDLVEWQLRIASGERLPLHQDEIGLSGHAIEVRLNAEDPAHNFRPSPGRILQLALPPKSPVRCDMGVAAGGEVQPYYDSMIGKFIAHAGTRTAAIADLQDHLARTVLFGPHTNMSFLAALLANRDFASGRLDTGLIGRDIDSLTAPPDPARAAGEGLAILLTARDAESGDDGEEPRSIAFPSPWDADDAFDLTPGRIVRHALTVDGKPIPAALRYRHGERVIEIDGREHAELPFAGRLPALLDGNRVLVLDKGRQIEVAWPRFGADSGGMDEGDDGLIRAPITGRVAKLGPGAGQAVAKGEMIAVVEAMKMEYVLHAKAAGQVTRVLVAEGAQVAAGAVLAEIAHDNGEAASDTEARAP